MLKNLYTYNMYLAVGASVLLTPIQPNNFQAIIIWPDAPFKK